MRFGIAELLIMLGIVLLLGFGPAVQERLGLRGLTFERNSDIVLGGGIVLTVLVTFLFLTRN